MQSRLSFNAGEFTPELSARADLDKYPMGCDVLENWEVGQFGGVKRRRGMRKVSSAASKESKLLPYVYSYADGKDSRFLVELNPAVLRVYSSDGALVTSFYSGDKTHAGEIIELPSKAKETRYYQLNKLLILTNLYHPPMVLKYDGVKWELEMWKFKSRPWRYTHLELQDNSITMEYDGTSFSVAFDKDESGELKHITKRPDYLRVSQRTDKINIEVTADVLDGVSIVKQMPVAALEGDRFAIEEDAGCTYYVCVADFSASGYVEGLESPSNYANAFQKVDSVEGFEDVTPVNSLKDVGDAKKGKKIAFKSRYWKYWTCVKSFVLDETSDYSSFEDYPEYFVAGLAVSHAVPSQGTWAFRCTGTWYGSFAVKRCYDGVALNLDWELRGVSNSHNDVPTNDSITGDEKEEECYLRLFVLRSRKLDDTLKAGFPSEMNHLTLDVDSYVHDITLKATPGNAFGDVVWTCEDKVKPSKGARIYTKDWSWTAFSDRYGYPLLCESYQQRLIFAGTKEQPLTIWMSRTDDIDNFRDGELDTDSIALTLSAVSQDPICWIKSRKNDVLLGTSSSEYVINSGSTSGVITSGSARSAEHAHRGSDGQAAIASDEKVVFIGRGGKRVYEYGYNYESDGYISRELSLLAGHIGAQHGGFARSSLMEMPETVVYFVLNDGQIALCTYNSMQEVRAWHRWVTRGIVHDVCVLPNGAKNDNVFFIVERNNSVNIELVNEDSPYVDEGGFDYESTLITNTLHMANERVVKPVPNTPFSVCFGEDCSLIEGKVLFSTDGGQHWYKVNSNDDKLSEGWHSDLCARSANTFNRKFGIKVSGNRGLNLLAIQA